MMNPVTRRQVFYIPGYDPFPPRRYRELYRRESAAQAKVSGYDITLIPRKTAAMKGWTVQSRIDGHDTTAEIDVLVWSDIVAGSMGGGIAQTYGQLMRTVWIYMSTGAFPRLFRLRKGPNIAALYPIGMLLVQLFLAVLIGAVVRKAVLFASLGMTGHLIGLVLGIATFAAVLHVFRRYDHKIYAYYLMHDYAFSAQWRGANPPQLEARLAEFRARIQAALDADFDEVLVVGHSSGAHLGVSILADLMRGGGDEKLSFLSLGHVVPMMSFLPDATRLRADLHDLAGGDMFWLDVTAPGDGCAFALCDPVAVSGVAPADAKWPLVISAAFTQTLSPARWQELRWRFFRLHFQYLCAFDRPGDYDYFQITAGPLRLGDRFANRAPSASRISTPLSPYTGRT